MSASEAQPRERMITAALKQRVKRNDGLELGLTKYLSDRKCERF